MTVAKQAIRKKSGNKSNKIKLNASKKALLKAFLINHGQRVLRLGGEILSLAAAALILVITVLGRSAEKFAGVSLWSNLVPFATVVLVLSGVFFGLFRLWMKIRVPLTRRNANFPALLGVLVALGSGWYSAGLEFNRDLANLRGLVGGAAQAERVTLSHQVYAAYRRADLSQLQQMVERAKPYESVIQEAAGAYGVDTEVLMGVGAAESSFIPRDIKDGGRGLFQITAPPKPVVEWVGKKLGERQLDWRNSRHNALIGAATWRYYLKEMKGDLFLSLLAYNIGPKNGGLLSIMQQYGAKDFVTIQPYLQNLPRDYPIRVLTAALAFRLSKVEGKLPRYEEGDNAKRIQQIGIPGLNNQGW